MTTQRQFCTHFFLLNVVHLFFCQIFQFASTLRHRLVRPSTENFKIQSREICLSTFLNYYIKSLMHNLWGSKWSRSSSSSGYFFFPLETWSPKRVSNPLPGPWKQSSDCSEHTYYVKMSPDISLSHTSLETRAPSISQNVRKHVSLIFAKA